MKRESGGFDGLVERVLTRWREQMREPSKALKALARTEGKGGERIYNSN